MVLTDEEQPLLRIISHDYESTQQEGDQYGNDELEFEPLDPEDPRNWSWAHKWSNVLLLAFMAFVV